MSKFALYVPLEAKPGKEQEVAEFLRSAVPLVNAEPGTISWFAIQMGPSSYAIFDTFDTEAGREEILARRIGHNELDTIQTALAYVDAQRDYADKDRGAGTGVYAQRFVSTSGKKDGLYWPTAQGEDESPLGELFAQATRQGVRAC